MAEQFFAGSGRRRTPADTLDQSNAQEALKVLHLQADRGLGQPELARRRREAAKIDNMRESFEVIELKPAHLKDFLMQSIVGRSFIYSRLRPRFRTIRRRQAVVKQL